MAKRSRHRSVWDSIFLILFRAVAHKLNEAKEAIKAYIELATKLGAPYIRVLADLDAAPGGESIYPKETEDFLYTNPKVKDVQVIGVPDKAYGEEIMACIVLNDGVESSEAEIKEFCLANMAKHKCPRYIRFVEDFPMNAAGKILRYKMCEEAVE